MLAKVLRIFSLLLITSCAFAQSAWQSSIFLTDTTENFVPMASASILQGKNTYYSTNIGLEKKIEVKEYWTTHVFAGASLFNQGILRHQSVADSANKSFAPGLGTTFSNNNNYAATLFRIHTELRLGNHFSFIAGYDTRSLGYGIQSTMRDPLSIPTPYFGYNYTFNDHISYQFQLDYGNNDHLIGNAYTSKYFVTHTIQYTKKRVSAFLFESVVWRHENENGKRGIDPYYLAPLIIYRPTEFALGSSDNVLLGAGFQYQIIDKKTNSNNRFINESVDKFGLAVYGQILIDEFLYKEVIAKNGWWANKHALQVGIKGKYLTANEKQLSFALEYNHARPYTYTHSDSLQSYSNGTFALSNIYGANFRELALKFTLRHDKWSIYNRLTYYTSGRGTPFNNGSDVIRSSITRSMDYGNSIGQNTEGYKYFALSRFSYSFKDKYLVYLEYQGSNVDNAIGIGISYSLNNSFHDLF